MLITVCRCAARDVAGKLIGIALLGVSGSAAADLLGTLVAAFPSAKPPASAVLKGSAVPVKFEGQDGSMAAAGYVLAQASTGPSLQTSLNPVVALHIRIQVSPPNPEPSQGLGQSQHCAPGSWLHVTSAVS